MVVVAQTAVRVVERAKLKNTEQKTEPREEQNCNVEGGCVNTEATCVKVCVWCVCGGELVVA